MKRAILMLALLPVLLGGGTASAHDHRHYWGRHHGSVGIYFGPVWPRYGYSPRYYYPPEYYPPVVVAPPPAPVYIERTDIPPVLTMPPPTPAAAPAPVAPPVVAAPESYWYYCSDPQGYYPYVKSCPLGWQKVAPAVPPQ